MEKNEKSWYKEWWFFIHKSLVTVVAKAIKMKTVFLWIVSIVLVLLFFLGGYAKTEFSKAIAFVIAPVIYGIFRLFQNMRQKQHKEE